MNTLPENISEIKNSQKIDKNHILNMAEKVKRIIETIEKRQSEYELRETAKKISIA